VKEIGNCSEETAGPYEERSYSFYSAESSSGDSAEKGKRKKELCGEGKNRAGRFGSDSPGNTMLKRPDRYCFLQVAAYDLIQELKDISAGANRAVEGFTIFADYNMHRQALNVVRIAYTTCIINYGVQEAALFKELL